MQSIKKELTRIWFLIPVVVFLYAQSAYAGVATFMEQPDTSIASNSVVDIIEHDGGIWMATGDGLNFTFDNGVTWLLYDNTNGLVANDLSALFSIGGRLWVATGHSELVDGASVGFSDALQYTDDNGASFTTIDFSSTGLDIPQVIGGNRSIFDITGHYDPSQNEDWLFFAGFAGGLLASADGGINWRRIYSSRSDSIDFNTLPAPPVRTLYFSCQVDTTHGDSLFLWTGTAGGVFQYIFAPKEEKVYSRKYSSVVFCDSCGSESFIYLAGDTGVTRVHTTGLPAISRFTGDGLPGAMISEVYVFANRIFVGTADSSGGASTGLAYSDDGGLSYTALSSFSEVIGLNRTIHSFASINQRLYLAGEEGGLFVSVDTGLTWTHIYVDSSNITPANRRNVVFALESSYDTLRVGTDSGLVTLFLSPTGLIDSSRYAVFPEGAFSSSRVTNIKTQYFFDSTGLVQDSLAIWLSNRPITDSGTAVVFRSHDNIFGQVGEVDTAWVAMQWGVLTNDFAFFGDTAFVVGSEGIRLTTDGSNPANGFPVSDSTNADNLNSDIITAMSVHGDTVVIATENGFALSNNRAGSFVILRPNRDSLGADLVINHSRASSLTAISGDFIPAIGIQHFDNGFPRIWVSAKPTFDGNDGISVGVYFPVDSAGNPIASDTLPEYVRHDLRWGNRIQNRFAWNFAFNGDTTFVATDVGVLMNYADTGLTWDTLVLVNVFGDTLVEPGQREFHAVAVRVIGDYLWVGTDQATVKVALNTLVADTSYFYVDVETPDDEVYAFPVPYRSSDGTGIDFRFVLREDETVTLEIYDMALNLVKRLIDNQQYPAGVYQGRNSGLPTWDGLNGKGDEVAVGVYYMKLELSSGETRWGKFAVIP